MCSNPRATLANLMAAIEPTIIALGNQAGLTNNPLFQAVLTAYNAALTAIQNWTPGTPAQDAIQVINDLLTALNALPVPAGLLTLVNIIAAGVETLIAVLAGNSPAPPAPAGADASSEETQALYQAQVVAEAEAKVQKLVPGFKRSIWHSAATQYTGEWNKAVKAAGLPASMLQA
jgi:hypothetical protein